MFFYALLINLIVNLIKKYNIYLGAQLFFSKNSENHYVITFKICNDHQLIYTGYQLYA